MVSLQRIFHPEIYQGRHYHDNYFEGWYYKCVTANQSHSIAFIPGVSLSKQDPHAFIQVIYTVNHPESTDSKSPLATYYIRFNISEFAFTDEPFSVQIGKNRFTQSSIALDLTDENLTLSGTFFLGPLQPIKQSLLCPNIMGFFGYLPIMECYHGIVSMGHECNGVLNINDVTLDFTGGKGYIEKDWGHSFPKSYTWIQSNHFSNPTLSLFLSVAHIPFMFWSFKGFICNLIIDDKEYRFATYNGAKIVHELIENHKVTYTLKHKGLLLDITAQIVDQGALIAPKNGLMKNTIKEGLMGTVTIKLYNQNGKTVAIDKGTSAGVEIVTNGGLLNG